MKRTPVLFLLFCLAVSLMAAEQEEIPALWCCDFSTPSSFRVSYRDGAKGKVSSLPGGVLKVERTNAAGYILIEGTQPFSGKKGMTLQCTAEYRADTANPETAIGFLRLYGKKEDLSYYKALDGRGGGGLKMELITNTPKEGFERKIARRKVDASTGNGIRAAIVIAGTPSVSYWRNWRIESLKSANAAWEKRFADQEKKWDNVVQISDAELERSLASEADHTAKLVKRSGFTTLLLDGKPVPPVFFIAFGSDPAKRKLFVGAREMEEDGVDMQFVILRFGSSPGRPGFWTKKGFDTQGAVQRVREAMRVSPHAKIILTMTLDAYPEFTAEHPETVWKNEEGRVVFGGGVHSPYPLPAEKPAQFWPWVSIHSKLWLQQVMEHMHGIVQELKRTGLSKRVIGVHFTGYHDNQFATRHLDYSDSAAEAFREFLKKERPGAAVSSSLPQFPAREFLSPSRDQMALDFFRFQKEGGFRVQERFARFIKKEFGKDILVFRYCMGAFGHSLNSAYDIGAFLNSDAVDVLIAQPAYARRTPGIAIFPRLPLASFHHHGKLYLNDFDLRTYSARHGKESELRTLGLSYALNYPMWHSIHLKMAGQMIAHHQGYRYLDMAGGWFLAPEIRRDIAETAKLRKQLDARPQKPSRADAALVVDESGLMLRNIGKCYYAQDVRFLGGDQLQLIGTSGAPCDFWHLDDFLTSPELAKRYKTVVFFGMFQLDSARKKLLKSLQKDNRFLVFLYGTGRLGGSVAAGFATSIEKAPSLHDVTEEGQGAYGIFSPIQQEVVTKYLGQKIQGNLRFGRQVIADDPANLVLARYSDSGKTAVALRKYPGWTGVYVAEPGALSPALFRSIVQKSGGYVVSPGNLIQADPGSDFLSLHTLFSSPVKVVLPGDWSRVKDLAAGKSYSVENRQSLLDVPAGSSCWLVPEK